MSVVPPCCALCSDLHLKSSQAKPPFKIFGPKAPTGTEWNEVEAVAMGVLHGDKLNTVLEGVGKKGCCMKVPNLQEAKTALVRTPLHSRLYWWCSSDTPRVCSRLVARQEKEWLSELNVALGKKLEAHLHNPKGPSLHVSIHFAPSEPSNTQNLP